MEFAPTSKTLLFRVRDPEDDAAWRAFAEIYTPLLFRFFRSRGLDESDAADVVQIVMIAVAKAIRGFDYEPARGTFRSWLYTVARSKLNDFFTRQAKQALALGHSEVARLAGSESDAEEKWEAEYRWSVFEWAAAQVRSEFQARTWDAFWRTAVEGESADAVAESLAMRVGAVYTARSRATKRLRAFLEDNLDENFGPPLRP